MELTHEDYAALAKHYSEQARMSMTMQQWPDAVSFSLRAQEFAKLALETYRSSEGKGAE